MKQNKSAAPQNQKPVGGAPPAGSELDESEANFAPSPDEVSRRAYFSYVNQGAPQGQHVQHWLDAEAQLIAERNRTRTHGFHNKT